MKQPDPVLARPLIKWAGGKASLLPEILSRLPEKINTYYEPFLGGGAVFFALAAEKRFDRAVLLDVNADLITTYSAVANDLENVIRRLKHYAKGHCEMQFYAVRKLDPKKLNPAERAARFIYLNKTCFNGLYRVNKKGEFNVPFGSYKNPMICDEENLQAVSSVLSKVTIAAHDFGAVSLARRGDAVYCDPPYAPLSETSNFTSYTAGGFGAQEQTRLRDFAKKLDAQGVRVLLSNSDTPFVREIYKGFRIEEVRARRSINSKGGKRGEVGELLISGKNAS